MIEQINESGLREFYPDEGLQGKVKSFIEQLSSEVSLARVDISRSGDLTRVFVIFSDDVNNDNSRAMLRALNSHLSDEGFAGGMFFPVIESQEDYEARKLIDPVFKESDVVTIWERQEESIQT